MKHTIDDWIEAEDDALGADLLEALGQLSPDPEDFAAGVAERIAAKDASSEDPLREPLDGPDQGVVELGGPSRLRWAAGVLPPLILPKGLTKLGLGAGTATASKLGLKFVPGIAMLPFVTLLMLVLTGFVALRGLFGRGRQHRADSQVSDQREAQLEIADWWRSNMVPAGLVLVLIAYLWFQAPHDGVVVLLLASTLAFVGVVGRLASVGLASRRELGRRLGGGLVFCMAMAFQLRGTASLEADSAFGIGLTFPILGAGAAVVFALVHAGRRGGFLRSLALTGSLWLLAMAALAGFNSLLGEFEADTDDLRAWIESGEDPDLASPVSWTHLALALEHLEASGERLPDLGRFAAAAQATVDRQAGDFNELYALPLLRIDHHQEVVRDSDRQRWAELARTQPAWVLSAKHPADLADHDLVTLFALEGPEALGPRAAAWYAKTLEEDLELPAGERRDRAVQRLRDRGLGAWLDVEPEPAALQDLAVDELERRVLAAVAAPDEYLALGSYLRAAEVLEWIGRGERAAELAPLVHRALELTWTPTNDGRQGAFPGTWEHQDRDEHGQLDQSRLTFVWIGSTSQALHAIARWGLAPDSVIELTQLERYLAIESRAHGALGMSSYVGLAVAARAHLQSLPVYQQQIVAHVPSWFDPLIEQRMPLAALLLVAFAIVATLRAPEEAVEPSPLRGDLQRFLLSQDEELVPGRGVRWWTVLKRMVLNSRTKD
ncbi:MAG: hypothetical protein P1V81_06275 [Planctomycetota bacterium]|nr:hypothetical protein [Planctomycetota bacterium]